MAIQRLGDTSGGVAQMVERSLSMREVPGSIPGASKRFLLSHLSPALSTWGMYEAAFASCLVVKK